MIASRVMRAIVVREFGGPDVMRVEERPTPKPDRVKSRSACMLPASTRWMGTSAAAPTRASPRCPTCRARRRRRSRDGRRRRNRFQARRSRLHRGRQHHAPAPARMPNTRSARLTQLHRLPPRVTYGQGASLGVPYATAYRSLFYRANARPGDTVLRPRRDRRRRHRRRADRQDARHGASSPPAAASAASRSCARTAPTRSSITAKTATCRRFRRRPAGKASTSSWRWPPTSISTRTSACWRATAAPSLVGNRGRVEIDARQAMARDAAILGMTLFNVTPAELICDPCGDRRRAGLRRAASGRRTQMLGERRGRTRPFSSQRARQDRASWPHDARPKGRADTERKPMRTFLILAMLTGAATIGHGTGQTIPPPDDVKAAPRPTRRRPRSGPRL